MSITRNEVIRNENISPFDVDGTLVMHEDPDAIPISEQVKVLDTLTNTFIIMRINRPMVRLLQESKLRGDYVIVWSRGGYQWAYNVIQALHLENDVDQIMTKPTKYFDDTDVFDWMPDRIYIKPDTIYKQQPKGDK